MLSRSSRKHGLFLLTSAASAAAASCSAVAATSLSLARHGSAEGDLVGGLARTQQVPIRRRRRRCNLRLCSPIKRVSGRAGAGMGGQVRARTAGAPGRQTARRRTDARRDVVRRRSLPRW